MFRYHHFVFLSSAGKCCIRSFAKREDWLRNNCFYCWHNNTQFYLTCAHVSQSFEKEIQENGVQAKDLTTEKGFGASND